MLIFLFILGLIIGSFLNCVIYRMEKEQNILGRSFCPACKHVLSWQDLFPILSFVFLKAKCRYCQKPISWQYPLVEFLTGFLFVFIGLKFFGLDLIYNLAIASLLTVIFVFDLKHYLVPDKIIYLAAALSILWHFYSRANILNFVFAGLAAAAFFLAIYFLTNKKGLGLGDVEIVFFMGLFLGFPNIIVALFFAFLAGALIGLGLMAFKEKTMKSELPFGPFLVAGTLFALAFGYELVAYYTSFLLF